MITPEELVSRIQAYDEQADAEVLLKAYDYAQEKHSKQIRSSGEPYFSHPLAVAGILAEMRLDTASIITALLHDVVEDTEASIEEVEKLFGPSISKLVDGVTKLTKLEHQSDDTSQAENFRKLVLAMSKDIRVLLVKLADRLHNMRTLHFIKNPLKRARIARETLEIYAPLAERIGIQKMKDELQDLAFQVLNPEARESILNRLSFLNKERGDLIEKIIKEIEENFKDNSLQNFVVQGRQKSAYSMWEKMQKKNVTFEQISDIMAFRVIVEKIEDCYQALGIAHSSYSVVPGRFKDYISTPKKNGYRSIHTAVIGPFQHKIEMQIRTFDMHEIAELGVAAHWGYKQSHEPGKHKDYEWIREILDIMENAQKPEEFLEHTKLELFQDQVFCFTPKGVLISLPVGATPVDFAYAVHSQLGDRCVGVKINGRMMPLRTVLENGDQVEILTSKTQMPSPAWERFVVTGKAKARIRKFIRTQQKDQYISLGKAMIQKLFREEGYDFTEKAIDGVLTKLKLPKAEDVYANIGSGILSAREVFHAIFPGHKTKVKDLEQLKDDIHMGSEPDKDSQKSGTRKRHALPLKGLIPDMAYHFAKCCHPLPGDRIVGIITTGKGVTIHTIDCDTLENYTNVPERWIDVEWDKKQIENIGFVGRIVISVANQVGNLGTLSTIIGKNGGNITNIKIVNRSVDFFDILIDVVVPDNRVLSNIMAALRATPIITSVERMRGK